MPKSSLSESTFTQGYSLSSIRKPFESKSTCSLSDWSKSLAIQNKWSIFFSSNRNYPNMIVFVKIIEPKVHKLYLFHHVFYLNCFFPNIRDVLDDLGSVTIWRLHGCSNACECTLKLFSTFMPFFSVCMS